MSSSNTPSDLKLMPSSMSFTDGNVAENWRRFKKKLTYYLNALSGTKPSDKKKVGILMTALGDAGLDVIETLPDLTDDSTFDEIIDAFDEYCEPRKNTIYERFLFYTMYQNNKSVDTFVVDLRLQARRCEFGKDDVEKLIRDRLVMGTNSERVRTEMLRDSNLTLETAIKLAKSYERASGDSDAIARYASAVPNRGVEVNRLVPSSARDSRPAPTPGVKCGSCGYEHRTATCPAADQECNYCHKKGHFASVCRKKSSKPKPIAELTPRLQRLRLRLLRYNFELCFQPGKELFVADTLSRAYLDDETADETYQSVDVHSCCPVVATDSRLRELVAATAADDDLKLLKIYLRGGWPKSKHRLSPTLRKFRTIAPRLEFRNELCFFNGRLVVPNSLVTVMLQELHRGHINVNKTKQLARQTLFWLGMSSDIELFVGSCTECNEFRNNNRSESLKPFPLPTRPWQRLHSDILTHNSVDYLVVYDSYSQWLELFVLRSKSIGEIIGIFKSLFSRFGIPSQIVSDNVPYNSADWLAFASTWHFEVLFSSPRYPQANGASEKAVAIAKRLLQKNTDINDALLQLRTAPIPHLGYSPAELLQGRHLRTRLPSSPAFLSPHLVDAQAVQDRKLRRRSSQKFYYDRGTRDLPPLAVGDEIYYKKDLSDKRWQPGTVVQVGDTPRSYQVEDSQTSSRVLRNRRFIRKPPRFRD